MRKPTFCICKKKTQISFAVTAKLISAFVFASRIVQSLYSLNPEFQASSHLPWLYSPVCVGPGLKPYCWFSHDTAHMFLKAQMLAYVVLHGGGRENHLPWTDDHYPGTCLYPDLNLCRSSDKRAFYHWAIQYITLGTAWFVSDLVGNPKDR